MWILAAMVVLGHSLALPTTQAPAGCVLSSRHMANRHEYMMYPMVDSQADIQVAVVGVGRMGRLHTKAYRKLPGVQLVAVTDPDSDRAATVADEAGCAHYPTVDAMLSDCPGLKAVSVAVPTQGHVSVAEPLLARRIACLVEKPLAPSLIEAKHLADHAAAHGALLQVGHTERYNPAIRAVSKMQIRPRFIEVDRISPMTFRSLDVGVVMDMMIHDLDIVLMLAGSRLARVEAVGVAVIGEQEDVANARLCFESGCIATLKASRLAMKTDRKLRLFSEDAYVSLDYAQRQGVVIRKSKNVDVLKAVREQLATGADLSGLDYSNLVQVEQLAMDTPAGEASADPLGAQLQSFVESVRAGQSPQVDGRAGYAAVEAAERVIEAIRAHRWDGISMDQL